MTRVIFRLAPLLAAALLGLASAQAASPYPVNIERQRGSILTIKHTPPPGEVRVRKAVRAKVVRRHRVHRVKVVTVRKVHRRKIAVWRHNPALAGGCRDGGYVRLAVPPAGTPHTLHRDICEGIAPIDSRPGAPRLRRW
ncbi:MAG TPA: hypothetical protein VF744_08550 [Beijerinckiaceae bacterium]|jgi:hypothetical protein